MSIIDILNELAGPFPQGTDKNTHQHSYGETYQEIFDHFNRHAMLNILEFGVCGGASLEAWTRYFPNANVYGVDLQDSRMECYQHNGAIFVLSDMMDACLPGKPPFANVEFDIIIDDASHLVSDIRSVYTRWRGRLKVGGFFVIEDIGFEGQDVKPYVDLVEKELADPRFKTTVRVWNPHTWDALIIAERIA